LKFIFHKLLNVSQKQELNLNNAKMSYYISTNDMTCIPLTTGIISEMVTNTLDKIRNLSNEAIVVFTFVMITFAFVMLFKINMLIINEMNNKIKLLNKEIETKNQTIGSLRKNVSSEKIKIDLTNI
jgi:predicted PurR-regulated permease PerM